MDENKIKQLVAAAYSGDKEAQNAIALIVDKANKGDKDAMQIAQVIQKYMKKKAAHGTKLQYIKSLKNSCAEDEELVYYRKGGAVECGCKKKEDGGPVNPKKKPNAVDRFKNDKKPQWTSKDDEKLLKYRREGTKNPQEKRDSINILKKWNNLPSETKKKYQVEEGKCGTKVKKNCGGSAIAKFKAKKGSKIKVSC